ncbi:MAG: P-II family nitrogen regulator [Dehalococcoidia bacterium]
MHEIKAFIRPETVDGVVHSLYHEGFGHLTTTHVRSLGRAGVGVDPKHRQLSVESGAWYTEMVKLEIVCAEQELERALAVIRQAARTGEPGDGIVFVTPVARAVKVRTGEEGREILQ